MHVLFFSFLLKVVQTEESFFTESLLFHTITIDEGHRLKVR